MEYGTFTVALVIGLVGTGITALITRNKWCIIGFSFLFGMFVMDLIFEFIVTKDYVKEITPIEPLVEEVPKVQEIGDTLIILQTTEIKQEECVPVLHHNVLVTYHGKRNGGCAAKTHAFSISPTDSGKISRSLLIGEQIVFLYNNQPYQLNLLQARTDPWDSDKWIVKVSASKRVYVTPDEVDVENIEQPSNMSEN